MRKEIVVNVGHRETRVAMVEDGVLAELKLEREKAVLGNIYKGTVQNVVVGLDAAFVDCGLDRNVFLHVSDAVLEEPSKKMLRRKMDSFPPIADVLKPGQEILMQVTKGSVGTKGPRAMRRVSLPGRYLVLMVQGGEKVGVSRKIADDEERRRLRDLGEKIRPDGMGIIIRTRAEGVGRVELQRDVTFLTRVWSSIEQRAKRTPSPALIHEDLSLVFEIIRDVFSDDVERFVVDDPDVHSKVVNLVEQIAPNLGDRIERYEGAEPIFIKYDLEKQIERALRRRVWLPRGGHINIDHTEALTAIDVNSGKFTGAGSLADTVVQTNLLAVEEVVRQTRVRDIGGIIVIDFIDMDNPNHRRKVMAKLKDELKRDRVRTRVVHLTPLGLVEMTRKRTGDPLSVQMQSTCPTCEGRGRIASAETTAIRIEDRLKELVAKGKSPDFRVTCTPTIGLHLIGAGAAEIGLLEDDLGRNIHVRCNVSLHPERFIINGDAPKGLTGAGLPFTATDVIDIEPHHVLDIPSEGLMALVDGVIVHVPDAPPAIDQPLAARLTEVGRSYVRGTVATRTSRRRRRRRGSGRGVDAGPSEGADEQPNDLLADMSAELRVEEPAEQPDAEPAERPAPRRRRRRSSRARSTAKPDEQPVEPPADAPAAEPAAQPAEEPADSLAERRRRRMAPVEAPAEKPAEEPADPPDEQPSEQSVEESAEPPAEKPAKRSPKRRRRRRKASAAKSADKSEQDASESPADPPAEEASDAPAEQPADEPAEKPAKRPAPRRRRRRRKKAAAKPATKPAEGPTDDAPTDEAPATDATGGGEPSEE